MITDGVCRHCGAAILLLLMLFASTLSVAVTVVVPVVMLAVASAVHRKEAAADGNKGVESLLLRSSKGRNDCGIEAAVLLLLPLAYLDLPLSGAAA